MPSPDPDPLDDAFATLREPANWSDDARHKAFIALALSLDRLPDAAARYKTALEDPALEAQARPALDRVLAAAMSQLEGLPRTSRDTRRGGRVLAPVALLGFFVAMSFLAATLTHNRAFVSPVSLALELVVVALLPWRRLLP